MGAEVLEVIVAQFGEDEAVSSIVIFLFCQWWEFFVSLVSL